ncbi:MAG: hypothetical protein IMF18_06170 [Proteobacteria bacterium]|nr:hypothetical protein [Pseudomonadota bacterium]
MKRLLLLTVSLLLLFCTSAFAGEVYETAVISANATWTDALYVGPGRSLDVSIYKLNSPVATIKLFKKFDEETTWDHEVDSWDAATLSVDEENITRAGAGGAWYRIGCAAGDYTSGNCTVRIGQYY